MLNSAEILCTFLCLLLFQDSLSALEVSTGYASKKQILNLRKPDEEYEALVEGYYVGLDILTFVFTAESHKSVNQLSAPFFTNAYRWGLRHIQSFPDWIYDAYGRRTDYMTTQQLWHKRFHNVNTFIPKWARFLIPIVVYDDWEQEEKEYKKFRKYAEPTFSQYLHLPPKDFDDFPEIKTDEDVSE